MKRLGLLEWSVSAVMVTLVAVVFAQVLLRYLTYQPLAWTEELARYLFLWLCLLGAAVATRRGQHFAVDMAIRLVPSAHRHLVMALMLSIEAVFYLVVAWAGISVISIASLQQSPSLGIPMSLPYLAIPAGAALMGYFCVARAYSAWTRRDI